MSKGPNWRGLRPNKKAVKIFETHTDISTEEFKAERHDVGMIVKVLHCVLAKWVNLGGCIKISDATMEDLKKKWKRNTVRGLIYVVDHWMKGEYEEKKLHPCWWSVVYMVADSIGGDNPAAARKIAANWKKYQEKGLSDLAKKGNSIDLTKLADKSGTVDVLVADNLSQVQSKWFGIGVLLGVPVSKLEEFIDDEVEDKLKAVINAWLEMGEYDTTVVCTMQVLIDAVADSMGGANKNLAQKLTVFNPKDDTSSQEEATPSSQPAVTSSSPAAPPDKDDYLRKPHTPTTENGARNIVSNAVENKETTEDDGRRKERHEARDRGTHTPELKFDDNSNKITTVDVKPFSKASSDHGYYMMDSSKHGVALIINNKEFKTHGRREGTDRDEDNLVETFLYLGYRVEIRRDCKEKEMMNIFKDIDKFLSESDKKSNDSVAHDSFVCCVLSHGEKGRIVISADSKRVDLEEIERKVGKSKVLNSKPKLFFIQACQGDNFGTESLERVQADDHASERGDFYFCYATVSGTKPIEIPSGGHGS